MKKMKISGHSTVSEAGCIILDEERPRPSADAVVWRGQAPPGPGPRKCWLCGYEWTLEIGKEDVCPKCGRPNVIKEVNPLQVQYVFRDAVENAEEVLAKSKELLKQINVSSQPDLSVGDLSVVTAAKREKDAEWHEKNRAGLEGGSINIGDLTPTVAMDEKGLDELFVGSKMPMPAQSESQRLNAERIKAWKDKQAKVARIKRFMFEAEQAKEG